MLPKQDSFRNWFRFKNFKLCCQKKTLSGFDFVLCVVHFFVQSLPPTTKNKHSNITWNTSLIVAEEINFGRTARNLLRNQVWNLVGNQVGGLQRNLVRNLRRNLVDLNLEFLVYGPSFRLGTGWPPRVPPPWLFSCASTRNRHVVSRRVDEGGTPCSNIGREAANPSRAQGAQAISLQSRRREGLFWYLRRERS